jgi:hypothetical protein
VLSKSIVQQETLANGETGVIGPQEAIWVSGSLETQGIQGYRSYILVKVKQDHLDSQELLVQM